MEEKTDLLYLLLNFDKLFLNWIKSFSISKWIKIGLIILAIISVVSCADSVLAPKEPTGTNVKIGYTYDSGLYYNPVCPYCNHMGSTRTAELSIGESGSAGCLCTKCWQYFEIEIKR